MEKKKLKPGSVGGPILFWPTNKHCMSMIQASLVKTRPFSVVTELWSGKAS